MFRCAVRLVGLLLPCVALAQAPPSPAHVPPGPVPPAPASLHATYDTFAAGIAIANLEAGFEFGPKTYEMKLGYHTTGMVGVLFKGHQFDLVNGVWHGRQAVPSRFVGEGFWRGEDRHADIAYRQGKPIIGVLVPPNANEREPVPESMQANTIDTLSALAELIHVVEATGACETTVHTYDGRRALEIQAHTVGQEMLEPTRRSSFAGKALRCDFAGRMLAGFRLGDDRERDGKPMHGSAWLAPAAAGGPLLPVRMVFETKWFGDATMYLTSVGPGSDLRVAEGSHRGN